MSNGFGRIFGLDRLRTGQTTISASAESHKADLLEQISNLRALPPMFMRRNGTGVEIGIAQDSLGVVDPIPCRVLEPLLNNEPMTAAQLAAHQDPAAVTYRVAPEEAFAAAVPDTLDLAAPLAVRYGRPFGLEARVYVARPGDRCYLSLYQQLPELEVISERVAARLCTPAPAPTQAVEPPPQQQPPTDGNSAVGFIQSAVTAPTDAWTDPDPQMATHATTQIELIDSSKTDAISATFYVGDADYATLTAALQADAFTKGAWGRDLMVEWSADNRIWSRAKMLDMGAGTKSDSLISADGTLFFDVRQGVAYLRATWDPMSGPKGSPYMVELRWGKKRGTRN